ncbi:hypothetical protein WA171_005404 [Blastocystis sp. BT1]
MPNKLFANVKISSIFEIVSFTISSMEFVSLCKNLAEKYTKETTTQVKMLDAFIGFSALAAIIQAVYCFLVGTYPFNAFLAGFIASLGSCVLSICFRMGITSEEFQKIDNNKIFAEYCFCMLLLFLVVCNYLG